jgi:hypothetical protein
VRVQLPPGAFPLTPIPSPAEGRGERSVGQVVESADTRRSERRAAQAWEFKSPPGHWRRAGARPAPMRPAAWFESGVSNCRTAGYANWQSGQVESLAVVGSTPTSATGDGLRVQRDGRRPRMPENGVQFPGGPLKKAKGRRNQANVMLPVAFSLFPFAFLRAPGPTERRRLGRPAMRVQLPRGPLQNGRQPDTAGRAAVLTRFTRG